jgi:hypothetical protein
MRYNFCTHFNQVFLLRGLTLYRSLEQHCPEFTLWVLCMDDVTFEILTKLKLKNAKLIKLAEFEDDGLRAAKKNRSPIEYIWTCGSSLPYYILKNNPELGGIAFLDADLYFFSSPEQIYRELGNSAVMIIPHRFSPDLTYLEKTSGTYNVAMVYFKNNSDGLRCLEWWRNAVLEWCYDRYEDGKYGDQLYLNDWPQRFKSVHVLKNIGANAAPWNIANHTISQRGDRLYVNDTSLIFFHFHAVSIYNNGTIRPHKLFYNISPQKRRLIYQPYQGALGAALAEVHQLAPDFQAGLEPVPSFFERWRYHLLRDIHLPLKRRFSFYRRLLARR